MTGENTRSEAIYFLQVGEAKPWWMWGSSWSRRGSWYLDGGTNFHCSFIKVTIQDEPAPCLESEGGPWVVQLLRSITIDSAIFDEVIRTDIHSIWECQIRYCNLHPDIESNLILFFFAGANKWGSYVQEIRATDRQLHHESVREPDTQRSIVHLHREPVFHRISLLLARWSENSRATHNSKVGWSLAMW